MSSLRFCEFDLEFLEMNFLEISHSVVFQFIHATTFMMFFRGKCHFADGRSRHNCTQFHRQLKCVKLSIGGAQHIVPAMQASNPNRTAI